MPLHSIVAGDYVWTEASDWQCVEAVEDTGVWETVYNFRIAEWHTYFVGEISWGWALWAHNAQYPPGTVAQEAEIQPNKHSKGTGNYLTHDEAVAHVRNGGDVLAKSKEVARQIARDATGNTPVEHTRVPPNQRKHYHPADDSGDPLPPHVMY